MILLLLLLLLLRVLALLVRERGAGEGGGAASSSMTISSGSSGERTGRLFTREICCSHSSSWLAAVSPGALVSARWRYLLTCCSHSWVRFTLLSSLVGRAGPGSARAGGGAHQLWLQQVNKYR